VKSVIKVLKDKNLNFKVKERKNKIIFKFENKKDLDAAIMIVRTPLNSGNDVLDTHWEEHKQLFVQKSNAKKLTMTLIDIDVIKQEPNPIVKNDDGSYTLTATKNGMENFLKLTFQNEFGITLKKGVGKFKTEREASEAYDSLIKDDFIPSWGYTFNLKGRKIICGIAFLHEMTFFDSLDDSSYMDEAVKKYKAIEINP